MTIILSYESLYYRTNRELWTRPLVIGTTGQRCQPGRSECLTAGCARWILSWQTCVHAGDWAAYRQAADT
jgi:hypothetical protein